MSSSIAIPKRKHLAAASVDSSSNSSSSSYNENHNHTSSASSPSSFPSSPMTLSAKQKSKLPVGVEVPSSPSSSPSSGSPISPRRPSLLGSSLSKSEYTVINLGHSDGPPRLVTCVKSSQGFDWNQELFLPSYADYDSHDLEHRPDPVFDIVLTDEEAEAIMPQ